MYVGASDVISMLTMLVDYSHFQMRKRECGQRCLIFCYCCFVSPSHIMAGKGHFPIGGQLESTVKDPVALTWTD